MTAVVNHVGHCVADLERAVRFYVDGLGFAVDRELELPDAVVGPFLDVAAPVGFRATYLRLGSFELELLHFAAADNPPAARRVFNEPGLTHLSICVDDLPGAVDRAEDLGGEVVKRSPAACIVRDPDGQLLELLPQSYREGPARRGGGG